MTTSSPGIRSIDTESFTDTVEGTLLEITDMDGSKRREWTISCEGCDFYESGLSWRDAAESAEEHTCE